MLGNYWKRVATGLKWKTSIYVLPVTKTLPVLCLLIISARSVANQLYRQYNISEDFQKLLLANGSNPVECQVKENRPSVSASISCIFPCDISIHRIGFHIEVFSGNILNMEFEDHFISCIWHKSGSIRCLGKDAHPIKGTYDVLNLTATIPIPLSTAVTYLFSCQLSAVKLKSHACQLHKTVSEEEKFQLEYWHLILVVILLSSATCLFLVAIVLLIKLHRRYRRYLKLLKKHDRPKRATRTEFDSTSLTRPGVPSDHGLSTPTLQRKHGWREGWIPASYSDQDFYEGITFVRVGDVNNLQDAQQSSKASQL